MANVVSAVSFTLTACLAILLLSRHRHRQTLSRHQTDARGLVQTESISHYQQNPLNPGFHFNVRLFPRSTKLLRLHLLRRRHPGLCDGTTPRSRLTLSGDVGRSERRRLELASIPPFAPPALNPQRNGLQAIILWWKYH